MIVNKYGKSFLIKKTDINLEDANFYIKDNQLVICFDPYVVACGAAGFIEFRFDLKKDKIYDLLNKDDTLWRTFIHK
ncbi:RsiV family protein [Anaeromicropila herbilytica]|uniref:DUF3298 domain-containing protein n=1 Tax=Anaeromicropila herbilytica TaxID=2785025 RepID=A0A7R7ELD1_9FIRM|nr:RsiV family protein [Anaeromicropila herbilytica]BCN30736.1 hypothetical protein bsdtb5_20310 [Anaeromicropila herbilytica]